MQYYTFHEHFYVQKCDMDNLHLPHIYLFNKYIVILTLCIEFLHFWSQRFHEIQIPKSYTPRFSIILVTEM